MWAVEETPPTNWIVENISNSGTLGRDGKIRFGGSGRTYLSLSYVTIPPENEVGSKTFVGVWSVDGSLDPIVGDIEIDSDLDRDQVPDRLDLCPGTATNAIVNLTGCSIDQLAPCDGPVGGGRWKNHGEYVSAVASVANQFLATGIITIDHQKLVVSSAAQSQCGRR